MLALLLAQLDKSPIQMGPFGTVLMIVVSLALAVLNAYQWKKSTEASHWKGSAQAYESELGIVRQRCERLETTNDTQSKEIAVLRARTDLDSLRAQASSIEKLVLAQGARLQEGHEAMLGGMQQLARTVANMNDRFMATHEEYSGLITSQQDLIKSLQSQMNLRSELSKSL